MKIIKIISISNTKDRIIVLNQNTKKKAGHLSQSNLFESHRLQTWTAIIHYEIEQFAFKTTVPAIAMDDCIEKFSAEHLYIMVIWK